MAKTDVTIKKPSKKYLIFVEVLNALTHGIGAVLSIVGLVFLYLKAIDNGGRFSLTSYIIYGLSLITLYLSSTLYHSFKFTKIQKVFRRIDHSSIFLLIAGTYTPYTLLTIGGRKGWFFFAVIWTIALFGVLYKTFWFDKFTNLSVFLYIGMGWMSMFMIRSLYIGLGTGGFWLLVSGGLAFTLGVLFYVQKNIKMMHVVWHLFVMAGTTFMFLSIYFYT